MSNNSLSVARLLSDEPQSLQFLCMALEIVAINKT